MFGFIRESIHQLVLRRYGKDIWQLVLERTEALKDVAGLSLAKDEEPFRLIDATSLAVGVPIEELWEAYGGFLIQYTMETGWEELLRTLSKDLRGFLDNLDALLFFFVHVVYKANLQGPSFRCEQSEDGTLILHYFSRRPGFFPIVKGVVREIARRVYKMEIEMTLTDRTQKTQVTESGQHQEEHVIFGIHQLSAPSICITNAAGGHSPLDDWHAEHSNGPEDHLNLSARDFAKTFPYHIALDRELSIVHCGAAILKYHPEAMSSHMKLTDVASLIRPQIPFNFEGILNFINGIFVLQLCTTQEASNEQERKSQAEHLSVVEAAAHKAAAAAAAAHIPNPDEPHREANPILAITRGIQATGLLLKGAMMKLENPNIILYLGSPYFGSIRELLAANLRLSSLPLHDATRDLILLNQQIMSEVELNKKLEQSTIELKALADQLNEEKAKTESLLREVLPPSIAQDLTVGRKVDASEYVEATVLFADIPQFQANIQRIKPIDIVHMLNDLFTRYDRLVTLHNVYKVETVGDNYMVVGGAPDACVEHCERVCNLAIGLLWEARLVMDPIRDTPLKARVGIHTGPIVAGIVGNVMPRYCLFGDTVNTASRMESHGLASRIHVSAAAVEASQKTGRFVFEERGWIDVKGKSNMLTYFLRASKKKSLWEIIERTRAEGQSIDGYFELNDESVFSSGSAGGATIIAASAMPPAALRPPGIDWQQGGPYGFGSLASPGANSPQTSSGGPLVIVESPSKGSRSSSGARAEMLADIDPAPKYSGLLGDRNTHPEASSKLCAIQ